MGGYDKQWVAVERVLVLQSFHESAVTGWVGRCLSSVQSWCRLQGYAYESQGDEFFDCLPGEYLRKVADRKPMAADLARLVWIEQKLQAGRYDLVAWLDADVLILAPQALRLHAETSCIFGREHWVQSDAGRYRLRRNVHNAYCAFRPGCPVLPFLIEAVQRMVRRVDPNFMAPQFVGPKLLTHLHNTVGFELDERIGALSPAVVDALLAGNEAPYQQMLGRMSAPLMAANLCASLHGTEDPTVNQRMLKLIERLLR